MSLLLENTLWISYYLNTVNSLRRQPIMQFQNMFQQPPAITPDEVKDYIENKSTDDYCLLDVRQPMEHAQGRLPGSILIPLSELNHRVRELNPKKPTIVYCRSGSRSASATSFLINSGIENTLNMTGGIVGYNGLMASGPPESAGACFSNKLTAVQLAATAWLLEEGTIKFIEGLCHDILNDHEPALFDKILAAKKVHQESLIQVAGDLKGEPVGVNFPQGEINLPDEPVMVGCVKVSDALKWAADKRMNDLLELMMSLSANAYDFYLRLERGSNSNEEKQLYSLLAAEEHHHLDRLTEAYETDISYR